MATWILGTGGHARALMWAAGADPRDLNARFTMTDENPSLGPDDWVIIGVGDIKTRVKLYFMYKGRVIGFPHLLTESTYQIMPRAYIMDIEGIGENVLINTGAQIDHDCVIGNHCVVSPGAVLCGGVTLGEMCYVSAGAIVLQDVVLEDETYVPPGAVVYGQDDIRVPARKIPHLGTVKA